MWILFAVLSSVFAALTSILAKVGIEDVNSTLATAIRTAVVLAMSWGMVFISNAQKGIGQISHKSWLFLILSGLATGASWLCYYKALQMGEVSKVVPIDKLSVVITLMLTEPHIDPAFLSRIRIPVLVTAGEHDLILPEETARLFAALPDAELVTVAGADHGSYIAGSPVMGELLLDFLGRRWNRSFKGEKRSGRG